MTTARSPADVASSQPAAPALVRHVSKRRQAQADVNSDLEAAKVIYQHQLDRLEDALRIHAKRSVIYGPLAERRVAGLDAELARVLEGETLRCRKIVKGLLDFARQTKPQKQALSLNQIVEDILALVRNQAGFRNVHIVTELAPRLPLVAADGDQVRQVMLNIILNAADAMPGGGELTIASGVDAGARTVSIRISDTGPSIPEGVKDRLFEPFFTTKSTGTGLGLAIAYGIVEQHKGTLAVESAPGKGATIVITLPVNGEGRDVRGDRES